MATNAIQTIECIIKVTFNLEYYFKILKMKDLWATSVDGEHFVINLQYLCTLAVRWTSLARIKDTCIIEIVIKDVNTKTSTIIIRLILVESQCHLI